MERIVSELLDAYILRREYSVIKVVKILNMWAIGYGMIGKLTLSSVHVKRFNNSLKRLVQISI